MISDEQNSTIQKLSSYGINISQFIRQAIKEKIERDYKYIKIKKQKVKAPF